MEHYLYLISNAISNRCKRYLQLALRLSFDFFLLFLFFVYQVKNANGIMQKKNKKTANYLDISLNVNIFV